MKKLLICMLCFLALYSSIGYAFEFKVVETIEGEEYYKKKKSKKLSESTIDKRNVKKLKKIYDSILKNMVLCPTGNFKMGSPENELGSSNNRTCEKQHKEIISIPFYIGQYEVTQNLYELITCENPSTFLSEEEGEEIPVENISWDDANDFCKILNSLFEDFLPDGYRFDLPTEIQWEYACRAGTTTALNNEKDLTSENDSCVNLDEVAWYNGNSERCPHPVGKKKPNAWDIYDMHGNVWEWCKESVYIKGKENKIIRGGSWDSAPKICRASYQAYFGHYVFSENMGFRIVLVTDSLAKVKEVPNTHKIIKKNNDKANQNNKLKIIDK